jgi:hypothetical protein
MTLQTLYRVFRSHRAFGCGIAVVCVVLFLHSCFNPFAPRLDTTPSTSALLGDQRQTEGVFQNFRYAYVFKDTLAFGQVLAPNFVFIYRNYERNVDVSWGRDEEMLSTSGLFRTAQALDLVWNNIVYSAGDSLGMDIQRGFNLTITFNANDVIRVDGRVNLRLVRPTAQDTWKIQRWRDESNF